MLDISHRGESRTKCILCLLCESMVIFLCCQAFFIGMKQFFRFISISTFLSFIFIRENDSTRLFTLHFLQDHPHTARAYTVRSSRPSSQSVNHLSGNAGSSFAGGDMFSGFPRRRLHHDRLRCHPSRYSRYAIDERDCFTAVFIL